MILGIFDQVGFLIPLHPLTSFYQDEPRFNGAYSRDDLSNKIKDGDM